MMDAACPWPGEHNRMSSASVAADNASPEDSSPAATAVYPASDPTIVLPQPA